MWTGPLSTTFSGSNHPYHYNYTFEVQIGSFRVLQMFLTCHYIYPIVFLFYVAILFYALCVFQSRFHPERIVERSTVIEMWCV